jgi:hypothetical protein
MGVKLGEWRTLHKGELHNLYSLPDRVITSRRIGWAWHVARMGETRNSFKILVVNLQGKRPFGRYKCRREDNIIRDLREMWGVGNWIHLAQDSDQKRNLVNTLINFRIP